MQRRIFLSLAVLLITLCACSQNDQTSEPSPQYHSSSSTIAIQVELPPELHGVVDIVSSEGRRPGHKNPVEAEVTLGNTSPAGLELLAQGRWFDARGNRYAGISQNLFLTAGETFTLVAGTRSQGVSLYKLSLSAGAQDSDTLTTAPLTDPSIEIAEGYGMTFSETAQDESIPALPIRGVANGEVFLARTVHFDQENEGRWRLEISDRPYDVTKGVAMARLEHKDVQTIRINLAEEPSVGDTLRQEMAYGGGYFQIKPSPDATSTTSWNTSLAYTIEIESWNKRTSSPGPCGIPQLGSASGKLYISFKGSGMGPSNSWVSGQFVDVPIVYCGEP